MIRVDESPPRVVQGLAALLVLLSAIMVALAIAVLASGCASTARPVLEATSATLSAHHDALAASYARELEACLGRELVEDVEACGGAVERQYAPAWAAYGDALRAWGEAEALDDQGEEERALGRALEAQGHAARAVAP